MAEAVAVLRVGPSSPGEFKCRPASRTQVL